MRTYALVVIAAFVGIVWIYRGIRKMDRPTETELRNLRAQNVQLVRQANEALDHLKQCQKDWVEMKKLAVQWMDCAKKFEQAAAYWEEAVHAANQERDEALQMLAVLTPEDIPEAG